MTTSDPSGASGWKHPRLEQHLAFKALSFDEKLQQIEQMADFAREIAAQRKQKGLPYIDPKTGERIPGVAEDQAVP